MDSKFYKKEYPCFSCSSLTTSGLIGGKLQYIPAGESDGSTKPQRAGDLQYIPDCQGKTGLGTESGRGSEVS